MRVTPPPPACPVHGGELPDDVAVADDQLGFLALEFQVLGNFTDNGERENLALVADGGEVLNHHVGADAGVVADPHPALDDAEGPYGDALTQFDGFIHQGGGVDLDHAHSSP